LGIKENYKKLRAEVPNDVTIVLACKTRNKEELIEAIEAGATDFGENYVQEAENIYEELGENVKKVKWHLIGALQKNKINKILPIVDTIQTVDSKKLADNINKRSEKMDKIMEVYIEVNSGEEENKAGVFPRYNEVKSLAEYISELSNIKLCGLMTMGKITDNKEEIRECFRKTKTIYDKLKEANTENNNISVLSMGMSDSYKIAIEEGANMIRVGSIIFGKRSYKH